MSYTSNIFCSLITCSTCQYHISQNQNLGLYQKEKTDSNQEHTCTSTHSKSIIYKGLLTQKKKKVLQLAYAKKSPIMVTELEELNDVRPGLGGPNLTLVFENCKARDG
ncbi:LOW QUALITY PROTEIN: hypothetical protein PanWU01x14_159010 [Parasponia andersonii]|uniref:Uncharacterized protein n=1 Tax=Parasponia andersonii TaxID=3476 RepID=A0A2P5CER2_PARAD|nr:LOW QUALITY PROTEIN: hypothetical protein PanWU01x14_159010 [Parasponia andersonii]